MPDDMKVMAGIFIISCAIVCFSWDSLILYFLLGYLGGAIVSTMGMVCAGLSLAAMIEIRIERMIHAG